MVKAEKKGTRLRIYLEEERRHEGEPLYEWIVRRALEEDLAGATVIRGHQGFGKHHRMHTAKILRLSANLPIIVEIVDEAEKINAFIDSIEDAISAGLITTEPVGTRFYSDEEAGE